MSLDGLRVNHAELDLAAENMYATVKKLQETLDNLEKDIEPHRDTWSGGQQQAYDYAKAVWDNQMKDMADLLDQSKNTVYTSNADYLSADKRGAARFMDM